MNRVVVNSSMIIALSHLNYLPFLSRLFDEVLIPQAVYEEICDKGQGLVGAQELRAAVNQEDIQIRQVHNRFLVQAMVDPLALGEAEVLALAVEVKADHVIIDDKLARTRAKLLELPVIGTLRVLRLFFDKELLSKPDFIQALANLRAYGFRISDNVLEKVKTDL